jgi:hypothetical protein
MFCDNPKCRLHTFDDQDSVEVFETNPSYFNLGGRSSGTKIYHNTKVIEPHSGQMFNLCETCAGVLGLESKIREEYEALPPLARAVKEVTNANDQH